MRQVRRGLDASDGDGGHLLQVHGPDAREELLQEGEVSKSCRPENGRSAWISHGFLSFSLSFSLIFVDFHRCSKDFG